MWADPVALPSPSPPTLPHLFHLLLPWWGLCLSLPCTHKAIIVLSELMLHYREAMIFFSFPLKPFLIYLLGCARSWLQHAGSSSFFVARGI